MAWSVILLGYEDKKKICHIQDLEFIGFLFNKKPALSDHK